MAERRCSHGPNRFQMFSVATRNVFIAAANLPCGASPTALSPLVLLRKPGAERREVLEQRAGVRLAPRANDFESLRPRLARTKREHRHELGSGFLAVVDGALVDGPLESCRLAERAMKLELVDARQKITEVRCARRDVELRAGVEVLRRSRLRRCDALVARLQLPPCAVVFGGRDLAGEHFPAPIVDEQSEEQEGDLLERHLHLLVDATVLARSDGTEQPDRLQVLRRHAEGDGVADGLVEAVVRALLKENRA